MDWVTAQEYRSYSWAMDEIDVRRMAFEVQQKLREDGAVHLAVSSLNRSTGTFRYKTLRFSVMRIGGLEELLLIEECIRRAQHGEDF